ncbi:MunI family type II restriction endonuclease [Hugenholtzia roseola]|uniref:MunI family type II restriction endonuclease n=1 Tax=Hugenholtzia roseola TaxID=1002 RepID=UPI00047E5456|nr:MunI family type II restriction endonuclease [Hugenholtzia roseola]
MGSDANRLRRKWQDYSLKQALQVEEDFYVLFQTLFVDTEYEIRSRPSEFRNIYLNIPLSPSELAAIYNPAIEIKSHGIFPDYAISNHNTNKTIYVEVKRQDGWVEGKSRSAGRGNAHERACKYFTPGLQRILREAGNLPADVLPFWTIFQGDITRDPCRVREITCWYEGFEGHFFFWRNLSDPAPLIEHFISQIQPLLD